MATVAVELTAPWKHYPVGRVLHVTGGVADTLIRIRKAKELQVPQGFQEVKAPKRRK